MSKISLNPSAIYETLDKYKDNQPGEGWEELWHKGEHLPWDRGTPNPALEEVLLKKCSSIGAPYTAEDGQQPVRKKALVPGCGRGVDVLLLASFGYDAYGLEYSITAVEECKKEALNGDKYPVRNAEIGRGKSVFVQGDFFKSDWLEKLGLEESCFDLVYDYTFFCALDPSMRPEWALRHTQLLAPSPRGNLICLEFPRHKDPSQRGPPWSSPSEAYLEHLTHPGEKVPYDGQGHCQSDPLREPSQQGLERIAYFQPKRTHGVGMTPDGEVLDRVSIWRHR